MTGEGAAGRGGVGSMGWGVGAYGGLCYRLGCGMKVGGGCDGDGPGLGWMRYGYGMGMGLGWG